MKKPSRRTLFLLVSFVIIVMMMKSKESLFRRLAPAQKKIKKVDMVPKSELEESRAELDKSRAKLDKSRAKLMECKRERKAELMECKRERTAARMARSKPSFKINY